MNGKTNVQLNMVNIKTGTELPSQLPEDSVFVITSIRKTEQYIQRTPPQSPKEGAIWLISGRDFGGEWKISIGNDNITTIYPVSAAQYVNGAWKSCVVYIRKNSTWQKLGTPLFVFGVYFSENGSASHISNSKIRGFNVGSESRVSFSVRREFNYSKVAIICDENHRKNIADENIGAQYLLETYIPNAGYWIYGGGCAGNRVFDISERITSGFYAISSKLNVFGTSDSFTMDAIWVY